MFWRNLDVHEERKFSYEQTLDPQRVADIVDCWFELPEKTRGPGDLAMELLRHTVLLLQRKRWGWPGLFRTGERKGCDPWVVVCLPLPPFAPVQRH